MAVLSAAPLQLIVSIPPVTRAFTALTIVFSLLYFWLWWTSGSDFSVPWLVLEPGSSIFYPWTFVTSAFVETTVIEVCVSQLDTAKAAHVLFLAGIYSDYCTRLTPLPGTIMGSGGNCQIRGSHDCRVQYYCVRAKLDRVLCATEPFIPVGFLRCS